VINRAAASAGGVGPKPSAPGKAGTAPTRVKLKRKKRSDQERGQAKRRKRGVGMVMWNGAGLEATGSVGLVGWKRPEQFERSGGRFEEGPDERK